MRVRATASVGERVRVREVMKPAIVRFSTRVRVPVIVRIRVASHGAFSTRLWQHLSSELVLGSDWS